MEPEPALAAFFAVFLIFAECVNRSFIANRTIPRPRQPHYTVGRGAFSTKYGFFWAQFGLDVVFSGVTIKIFFGIVGKSKKSVDWGPRVVVLPAVAVISAMAALAIADLLGEVPIVAAIFADVQAAATLIGVILTGVIGFSGVAWTLAHNARLERERSENAVEIELRKMDVQAETEARGNAAAVAGEAENIFRTVSTRIELALTDVLSDPDHWKSASLPLPTPVFQALAGSFGPLGTHLAGRVSQVFGHYQVMFDQLFSHRDRLDPSDVLGWAVLWVPLANNVARLMLELRVRASGAEPLTPEDLKKQAADLLAKKFGPAAQYDVGGGFRSNGSRDDCRQGSPSIL